MAVASQFTSLLGILLLGPCFCFSGSKKKVLVIGGTQFIGRHTVELLRSQPHVHVEIVHTGRSPSPWSAEQVPETLCDRRKPCLAEKLREEWWMVVDFPVYSTADAHAIFKNAKSVQHYVFISTDNVYMVCDRAKFHYKAGRLLENAVRPEMEEERNRLNDDDEYGHNKKEVEERLAAEMPDRYTSLRLPDVWGPHENTGRFGQLIFALARGRSIGLTVSARAGPGDTFSPAFVFAKDVAQMVLLLVNAGPQGIMNLAVSEAPTLLELIKATHELLPNAPPLQLVPSARAPLVSVDAGPLSIERARSVGFSPTPWRDGWQEAVDAGMDSLPPPREPDDNKPLAMPADVGLGRVRLRQDKFRQSFARFEDDATNGLTFGKLKRKGEECEVVKSYGDKTITCLFGDGVHLDFPWETVAEQLTAREEL